MHIIEERSREKESLHRSQLMVVGSYQTIFVLLSVGIKLHCFVLATNIVSLIGKTYMLRTEHVCSEL